MRVRDGAVPVFALGPRSCDLRSIAPLSQMCAYQRQPASEEPRVVEVARLKSDETELNCMQQWELAAATPFERSAVGL
jgi:hypothetical protein